METMYRGTIIEESLVDKSILEKVKIISTKIEPVKEQHKTPWVKQWTLHSVEVSEAAASQVAQEISQALISEHSWYADFKTDAKHDIIFRDKIFLVDRTSKELYDEAKNYGIALGIPDYQVDFHPEVKHWER